MTLPSTPLEWVRPPKQVRSRATLDRLLDAAEEMLGEKTWDECSVTDIARRAGSSVGAFYQRFADKDGLLHALHERTMAEALATIDATLDPSRWDGASIADIMKETVSFSVQTYRERAGLIRAFAVRSSTDPKFRERLFEVRQHMSERLRALILARRKELLHPAPAIAADFTARLVNGVLQAHVFVDESAGGAQPGRLTEEQLTTELLYATLSYLGVFTADALDS